MAFIPEPEGLEESDYRSEKHRAMSCHQTEQMVMRSFLEQVLAGMQTSADADHRGTPEIMCRN
ncbi:MAG: hypothetical protein ACLUE8_18150 [Lachnospiraceae bacterium]